jgi:uncharacterized membrane protein YeaQ/YmgE (transglycosylase-associated protein family)
MYLSGESLIVILFVGLVAGWLAGKIVRGAGFGIVGDIVIGIIGAFISTWRWSPLGDHLFRDRRRHIVAGRTSGSRRRPALTRRFANKSATRASQQNGGHCEWPPCDSIDGLRS